MAQPNGPQLQEIDIDAGKMRVVVARRFPLERVRDLQFAPEQKHVQGKVVLELTAV